MTNVFINKVYQRLPVSLQNAAVSLYGLDRQHKKFGRKFSNLLAEYRKRDFIAADALRQLRDARLRSFVSYSATNVPYYRDLFARLKIKPEDICKLEDLERLPILTKAEVQRQIGRFIPEDLSKRSCLQTHTSGTTGAGLIFPITRRASEEQWAVWWRYRARHGVEFGTWGAVFGGRQIVPVKDHRPPFWRIDHFGRRVLYSVYHMTAGQMDYYVDDLRRRRLTWVAGYPSALSILAEFMLQNGIDLGYRPRAIFLMSESVLAGQEARIKEAFGVQPLQHYGLAECVANASQCEYGSIHVDEDYSAVELCAQAPDRSLRIIGTNFTNLAFPLLRYDTGDLATLGDKSCACGRAGRILRYIDGRKEDCVVLADGAQIRHLGYIFQDMIHVREAQIVQRRPGAITVRLVVGPNWNEQDIAELRRQLSLFLGDIDYAFQYVDTIARSPSGKLRFVVSEKEAASWPT